MSKRDDRREFLRKGGAVAAGVVAAGAAPAAEQAPPPRPAGAEAVPAEGPADVFSRWYPSRGGPPGSDTFHGKLVPGLRASGLPPVPTETPDVPRLPFKMVDGWKVFHLVAEPVRRELLPGIWGDLWGYNGSVPGPTIEATQGDRVRVVVENRLPEATTFNFKGGEVDVAMNGVQDITQDPIPPGKSFTYEYDLHQAGTFFYDSNYPLERAQGMVGFFIIHPKVAFDPPVDRDFAIAFQDWRILPNNTIPNPFMRGGPFRSVNGRVAPYATPMVVRHGERVRIRVANFSKIFPHSIRLHGHTFWITGYEGGRNPKSQWIVRNTTVIHVLQNSDIEFVANNPGDWLIHCRMTNHQLNFIPTGLPFGPRMREGRDVGAYKPDLDTRPPVKFPHTDPGHLVPGYTEVLEAQQFTPEQVAKLNSRRETAGMRPEWYKWLGGLTSIVRVLPAELYDLVMNTDKPVPPGTVFRAIVDGRERWRKGA